MAKSNSILRMSTIIILITKEGCGPVAIRIAQLINFKIQTHMHRTFVYTKTIKYHIIHLQFIYQV